MSEDLRLGTVQLPSGRVVVGEYLFDADPLGFQVASGAYPAHATLARYKGEDNDSVAFATLVLSDAPTLRWEEATDIAVDGGTTTITSVEGRDELRRVFDDDPVSLDLDNAIFDSMVAHDYLGTNWKLTPETNLVRVSSGVGDGGYPVYVGYDAAGNPTRVVVDFLLLHLGWPGT